MEDNIKQTSFIELFNKLSPSENKLELKFAVEAMTQCGANCIGCFLTPELKSAQNFWDIEKFNKAKRYIKDIIKHRESFGQEIQEIALNMGQGDYLQLNEEQIKTVVDFIYDVWDGKASAFITTSGVANHEKVKKATDLFYRYSMEKNQPLLIDLVLDASRLSTPKMMEVYAKNISYIRSKFGHLDVNLNVNADTVENFPVERIDRFMKESDLNYLVINLVPANHNKTPLQKSWNKIVNWLGELFDTWDNKSYKLNYADSIKFFEQACPANRDIHEIGKSAIYNVLMKSYVIDNTGNVFFQQAGFGDLPLTTRNGFTPIAHIEDIHDYNKLQVEGKKVYSKIIQEQLKAPCNECEYQNICASAGLAPIKKLLLEDGTLHVSDDKTCPINMKNFYKRIASHEHKHQIHDCFGNPGIFVQRGYQNPDIKIKETRYSDKEINIPKQ